MIGRSCRRFGLCKGSVYVITAFESDDMTSGGKDYLRRNDNRGDIDEG